MKKIFPFSIGILVLVILTLAPIGSAVAATDLSLPYRNYPSFYCYHWSNNGWCSDFTYDPNDRPGSSSSNNYYYNNNYSSSSYYSTSTNRTTGTGPLKIEIFPDGGVVHRGDLVEYRIRLTNNTNSDIRTSVRAFFDSDMDYQSASDDGNERGTGEVEWTNIIVDRRSDTEVTFRVRINSRTTNTSTMRIRVETNNNSASTTAQLSNSNRTDPCYDSSYYSSSSYYYSSSYYNSNSYYSNCNTGLYNGIFTVRVFGTPDPFVPGQLVTYTITVRNEQSVDSYANVRAVLDPMTTYVSGSDNVDPLYSRDVRWDQLFVPRDSTRTLTLTLRTDRGIRDGDQIQLRVDANNDSDTETLRARF